MAFVLIKLVLGEPNRTSELLQGMIYIFWLTEYGSELPADFYSESESASL